MKKILVDTWAWSAMTNRRDTEHELAKTTNKRLADAGYHYVTTNFILDETYTLIRMKLHHRGAVEFGHMIKQIKAAEEITVVQITAELEEAAWEIFERYDDKDFSFTDCTSFQVMLLMSITEAFTDDHHFEQFGFVIYP